MKKTFPYTKVNIDDLQFYLAHQAKLHPLTYTQFVNELTGLEIKGKICPVPLTILERFHLKFKKAS